MRGRARGRFRDASRLAHAVARHRTALAALAAAVAVVVVLLVLVVVE